MIDRRDLLCRAAATFAVAAAPVANAAFAAQTRSGRTKPSRTSEVRALRRFAEATHPRGAEARDDGDWQGRWERLERTANALPGGAYLVETRRALAWFGDGHSTVLSFDDSAEFPDAVAKDSFELSLPWKVKLFDDGAYVTALRGHPSMLGVKVERVGRLTVPDLIRRFAESWPGNRAWAHSWAASALSSPAELQALGASDNLSSPIGIVLAARPGELELAPERGKPKDLVELARRLSDQESWAQAASRGNYVKPLPDRRAIYLSIDEMADVEGATFEQLTKEVFAAMDSADFERIVIDLRRNGGGNNFLGEALRKHIERSRFNRAGGLYVLTGPATFSAAQNLANRLERETYALFVGGPTGLSPNHYGDAKIFTGKVTGLRAMVSTLAWFDSYPQDKREWILPDLPVTASLNDWRGGRDRVLDLALGHRPDAEPGDWSSDRVFYYRRASQKADWKPFWT